MEEKDIDENDSPRSSDNDGDRGNITTSIRHNRLLSSFTCKANYTHAHNMKNKGVELQVQEYVLLESNTQ